jgi:DNA-binding NtrC family response regulator
VKRAIVLVVEDEFLVRLYASEAIRDAGYEAIEAGNAETAIDILERRDDVGAVFTDINMPGTMNGVELAKLVSQRWPMVRVVLTSGRRILRDADLPKDSCFIPKPYTPLQIEQVLSELLSSA